MAFDPLIFTENYLRVRAVPTCHTSTYVWCHGKGQKGGDWQYMVEPLRKLGHCNHIAFIFPYLDYTETPHGSSISKNEALVQKIVDEEIKKGCHPDRISVGGFNEGLDVALLATLADERNTINGVHGITERFAPCEAVKTLRKSANASTPVSVVDRSGVKNNAGEEILLAVGHPVAALVAGSSTIGSQPVTQEELEKLDVFIHRDLPVEFAEKK